MVEIRRTLVRLYAPAPADAVLERLLADPEAGQHFVHVRRLPERPARLVGPQPGPGPRVPRTVPRRAARGRRFDVRRRYARPGPPRRPRRGAGGGHEPGHAPFGDPPPPHEVVPPLRASALRRGGRAPYLPRPVRQPRCQRAAPPLPHLRALRVAAAARVLLRDHPHPAPAGRPG